MAKARPKHKLETVNATPFPERAEQDVFNASEVVPLGDGRFLFCDNNISDTLFEMRFDAEGALDGKLVRHKISSLSLDDVDDLEGLAAAEHDGKTMIYAVPSLSLKKRARIDRKKSKRGKEAFARYGLLRITRGARSTLFAEVIPDLRSWLLERVPILMRTSRFLPDDGGLNLEALAWDPRDDTLVLGFRTPVARKGPIVLKIKVKETSGPWTLDNLEYVGKTTLRLEEAGGEQGIRSIEYDPTREAFLVVTGNSRSASKVPFSLYLWDGNVKGKVKRFRRLAFDGEMRAEGVTHGTIGGRGAIVFVDDAGGYNILWDDDARLALE
jgi:hypothetical protein